MIPFTPTKEELPRLLDGSQALIVRAVEPQPVENGIAYDAELGDIVCHDDYLAPSDYIWQGEPQYNWTSMCPLGAPGDVVFCQEEWAAIGEIGGGTEYWYRADRPEHRADVPWLKWDKPNTMPQQAARLYLRIKSADCRRVQTVTEDEARAAGIIHTGELAEMLPMHDFIQEWDRNNPKRKTVSNPWAWFVQVERCEKP